MKLLQVIILFTGITLSGFSQEKIIKHTVQAGETVTQIAIKYKTTPLDIYKLNPDAQSGIKTAMILLVPNKSAISSKTITPEKVRKEIEKPIEKTSAKPNDKMATKSVATTFISHVTTSKETLYSLAVQYKTTIQDIENANPTLATNGLKIGDAIQIPTTNKPLGQKTENEKNNGLTNKITSAKTEKKPSKNVIFHTVTAKETKYSIANTYELTIEELEKTNPEIVSGLKIGAQLKIVTTQKTPTDQQTIAIAIQKSQLALSKSTASDKPSVVKAINSFTTYTIRPKETLYSLGKKFALSQAELLAINPSLTEGVKENEIIKVPSDIVVTENDVKVYTNLSKSAKNQDRKKLVLLLPFNLARIENDSVNSATNRIKTDKFLNMTLDFYEGALMAIDSAKTLGITMDIKILDSQETKNSSNIANLIDNQNLANSDAIIGPFYQSNVERTAALLSDSKLFIISPLSKEKHKPSQNLIVANAENETVKNAIFDFMKSKNGNILGIIDNKRASTKQFLKNNYPDVRLIPINEKNTFATDSLAQYCNKSKINFVILDSEKTGLILKTTAAMMALQKDYQMQLVILEKNETLDFDEIPLARLTKLKMIYPSLTRDNESNNAKIFEKEFKQKNKVYPNAFATRGFDLTFDTILRLAQDRSFEDTINQAATEQIENKFEYEKNSQGGFNNKGIYILEYQQDLTIKEVK